MSKLKLFRVLFRRVPVIRYAQVLTLAADPDAADGKQTIFRYDRAGLMLALKSAGAGRGR